MEAIYTHELRQYARDSRRALAADQRRFSG
jgi:hypothetical protein